jgi:putative DNA primase/helicase
MYEFNREDVLRAVRLLHGDPEALVELRVLSDKGVYSGYFTDFDKLATAAECWNGRGNIYVTLNRVHPDCEARRLNRLEWVKSGATTKDTEIVRRTNVYIDCDPKRLSGIASTDEEHAASLAVAREAKAFLREQGLPEAMLISSGNGSGLLLAIDLPADDDGMVKRLLGALAAKFDTDNVSIDRSVCNASRIARLPGTMNCKGENLPDRPHRLATIVEAPERLVATTAEQLQAVIDFITGPKTQPAKQHDTDCFQVGAWLDGLGVQYTDVAKEGGTQYSLDSCPFKSEGHPPGGCAIFQKEDGSVVASCFHANCKGRGWDELRRKLDPSFDQRADAVALAGHESVTDPHRLARIVLKEFEHAEHHKIVLINGIYYTWNDGVWTEQRTDDIKRLITRSVKAEVDRYAAVRATHGAACQTPQVTTKLVGNVLNALASMVEVTEIDGPGWLCGGGWPVSEIVACNSSIVHLPGYIDGREDYEISHTPRLFITNKLDFDFDPSAQSPARWLQLMEEIWPNDSDSVKLSQEFFGYCLTPDVGQQKFLMLIGMSRGGKGTITRALAGLVGKPNYCAIRLGKLVGRFGLENAVNKSLILVPDANMPGREKAMEIVELLKAIVGCDPLDVDRKGRPIITTPLPAKIVISSNKMIALPDESAALYNRMSVLRFTQSFLGKEDKNLDDKLRAELPGIMLWAIKGFQRLQEHGCFTEPESGRLVKDRLKAAGSSVATFVEDRCVVDGRKKVEREALYQAYRDYCGELQVDPCGNSQFGTQLAEAVPSVDDSRPRKGGKRPRHYLGIGLRDESIVGTQVSDNYGDDGESLDDGLETKVDRDVLRLPAAAERAGETRSLCNAS